MYGKWDGSINIVKYYLKHEIFIKVICKICKIDTEKETHFVCIQTHIPIYKKYITVIDNISYLPKNRLGN